MNVLIVQVGYFDPFVNVADLKIQNPGKFDQWGIFRCFPIKFLLDFDDNWILRKDSSLNKFPLTFSLFERYPTMVSKLPPYFEKTQYAHGKKHSKFGGIDGFVLGSLAEKLDFTVNVINISREVQTYGFKLRNGSFTGSIADVLNGYAHASFNGRFLIDYGSPDIEFTVPVLGDKVCVIAPAAEKIPQWKAIFKCFDIYFWSTFLLFILGSSLLFSILKSYQQKNKLRMRFHETFLSDYKKYIHIEHRINFTSILITTWKVMIGMNENMRIGMMERFFIGSCLLANVIISGSFEVSFF